MAAVSKAKIKRIVKTYQDQGLGDLTIMIKLLKRKDDIGKNLQTAIDRYKEAGSKTPLEDVGGLIGLNPVMAPGSREAGQVNPNPTLGDKIESYATSAGMGLADLGGGIVQGLANLSDGINSTINDKFGTNYRTDFAKEIKDDKEKADGVLEIMRQDAGRSGTDVTRIGTEIGASIPLYLTGGGATLPVRMAQQAGVGGLVGAARYADDAEERGFNILGGAAGGALGQAAGEAAGAVVSKGAARVMNARRGNLKPEYREIDELGKKYNVRTTAGDVSRGAMTRRVETALEQVPVVGTAGFREAQHSEAQAAAKQTLGKLENLMNNTDFKAIPQIEKAAQAGDRNAGRVLGIINAAGSDTGKIIQAGAEVRAFRESQIASRLYDKVGDAVRSSGNDVVTPTKTGDTLKNLLDEQNASLAPDGALLKDLEDIQGRLSDPNITKSFSNMRLLRSQLGDLADQYARGANPNMSAAKVMGDLRQAVDDDIAKFAANSGNSAIKEAYKRADKFYRSKMLRADKAIAKAMDSDKPDEIYAMFIKTGKGDRAENFYNALDPKSQAALRYQMADNALNKATSETTDSFSPAKFAGEFERMAEPYSRIFKGEDKKQMDGFVKLMRHIERAGQYKENPPTGNRVIPWLVAGATAVDPTTAIRVGGLSLFARSMLTTKAGKNLLLSANKLPQSQQAAMDRILMNAAKVSAAAGSKSGRDALSDVAGTRTSSDGAELSPTF